MSISTTTRKAGPFAGNDAQTVFAFAFKVFTAADVVVTRADADGAETELTLSTDYSVTLNGDQDAAPGGDVTLVTPLASDYTLAITSGVDALQAVTVTNGGGFFPSVFNGVFDRLTILVQQVLEQATRTFRIPVTASGVTDFNVPVLASGVLQWNADGTGLVAQSLPDLSLSLALPDMTGKADRFLTNDGASAAWSAFAPVAATRAISGGGMITGGGDLSSDRTLSLSGIIAADLRWGNDTSKVVTVGGVYAGLAEVALTYSGANIVTSGTTLDNQTFDNASITLTQNSTLPNLTNPVVGKTGRIRITNAASWTLAYGANWKPKGNVTPTMPTGAGYIAILDYDVITTTYIRFTLTAMQ